MLTTLQKLLKRFCLPGALPFALPIALPIALGALVIQPAGAKEGIKSDPADARPPGLLVIFERPVPYGNHLVGVYAVKADPHSPGLWQIKLWDELPNDMKVISETIRCNREAPMRVTSNGPNMLVRELNPGGPIHPGNRMDHLIWWATCYPQQAGKDPANLAALARSLGYSGALRESEQVLPGRGN